VATNTNPISVSCLSDPGCNYRTLTGSGFGCSYSGACQFQRPLAAIPKAAANCSHPFVVRSSVNAPGQCMECREVVE
jgi:hypothetical protein